MREAITNTALVMRRRFGMILKARREDLRMTQQDVADQFDHATTSMVSQQERGTTAIPPYALGEWADVLRMDRREFAELYAYYCMPDVYRCMFGRDPYKLEQLARPTPTVNSAPGRPAARPASLVRHH